VVASSVGREDHNDRTRLLTRELVCFLEGVSRQVDRETLAIGVTDRRQVLGAGVLVTVREAPLAAVCVDKLGEHQRVDLVAAAGEIASDVVSPELAFR